MLTHDQFKAAAETLKWTYAKSMPWCPHEYIVRNQTCDEPLYLEMFHTINTQGEYRPWGRGPQRRYVETNDGWKYWAMTEDVTDSRVINRARVKKDGGWRTAKRPSEQGSLGIGE